MARPRKTPRALPSLDALLGQYMRATLLTPAQQRAEARRTTNLALGDEMRALRTQHGYDYERARREQNAANVMGQILASYRSADAAAMRAPFSAAQGQVQGLGTGLINEVQAAQQAGVTAGQESSARLAGFQGEIPGMPSPAANALTSRQLGITIPSELLSSLGTSEYAHGLTTGTAQASKLGQQATQGMDQRLRDIARDYSMKVADIQAQRPGLLQKALEGLRGGTRSDFATLINAYYLRNTIGKTAADAALDAAKLKASVAASNAKTSQAQSKAYASAMKSMGYDAQGNLLPGYWKDPKTGRVLPLGWTIKGGVPTKVPTGAGAKAKQPTFTDWAKTQTDMRKQGAQFLGLGKGQLPRADFKPNTGALINYLMRAVGQAFVSTYGGGTRQQVEQVARSIAFDLVQEWQRRRRKAKTTGVPTTTAGGKAQVLG
jgi:hypothetical protein